MSETPPPNVFEQKLWNLYDATPYAVNYFNLPLVAYSGEKDRQIQAAQVMAEALKASLDAAAAIDKISADLREETRKGIVTREAMRQATQTLDGLNDGLASVATNAERDAQKEGLEKAGTEEALRVAGERPEPAPC